MTDPEQPNFFKLGYADDGGPIVSREAFQLHGFAMVNGVQDGTPGFISDDYLNAIGAETTGTAAELCLVGLWARVEGGYETHDPMVTEAVRFNDKMRQDAEFCSTTGGHQPDAEDPLFCAKCHAPLGTLPGPPKEHPTA